MSKSFKLDEIDIVTSKGIRNRKQNIRGAKCVNVTTVNL